MTVTKLYNTVPHIQIISELLACTISLHFLSWSSSLSHHLPLGLAILILLSLQCVKFWALYHGTCCFLYLEYLSPPSPSFINLFIPRKPTLTLSFSELTRHPFYILGVIWSVWKHCFFLGFGSQSTVIYSFMLLHNIYFVPSMCQILY